MVSIALALLATFITYTLLRDPLGGIPGPFWAPFSRLWMVHHSRAGNMHTTMIGLHAKNGYLVRPAPNEVYISDSSAIKIIYGAGTKVQNSYWYSVWQDHRKFDLFGRRDEEIPGQHRRLISNIYSKGPVEKVGAVLVPLPRSAW
ncbi:hypothetical protein CC80DRAFT_576814 [Byssothecium circinans]|uniref:Cytochrome P450 n=1 Tax=Byssothecium circinans TaxID=147558 RepID=A0A6A5TF48_9PLEO|nr:hypothetical protein CC80DRAFT_576814 [Byssothecium circinans]